MIESEPVRREPNKTHKYQLSGCKKNERKIVALIANIDGSIKLQPFVIKSRVPIAFVSMRNV